MIFLNKTIKLFSAITLLVSASVFAGNLPIDNQIILDQNDTAYGGSNYEIDKMLVNWDSNNKITVDIYTNFGSNNNKHRASNPGRKIIYGDLLIGTQGEGTDYNYAFSLGNILTSNQWDQYLSKNKYSGYERYYSHNNNANSNYTSGGLYAISDTLQSSDYHTNGGVREGEVFADLSSGSTKMADGSWGVNNSRQGFDIFSFSFNVANIEAFQNASQLSLSWAMSCYNDVITATINKSSVAVPLPATSILIMLALALMLMKQRQQSRKNSFTA